MKPVAKIVRIADPRSLHGAVARKIGFGWFKTINKKKFVELCVYRIHDGCVITMSDGPLPYNEELSRRGLGVEVPGWTIAPYAQRLIQDLPMSELKEIVASLWFDIADERSFNWEDDSG